jgi:excisionase family DNA binding protein
MERPTSIVLPDPTERPTLTVDAVAEILGLDRKTVYTAINSGELPSIRVGRRILVPTSWLAARITPDSDVDLIAPPGSPQSQHPAQGELPFR